MHRKLKIVETKTAQRLQELPGHARYQNVACSMVKTT